ncbi:MAG: hypothetical protein ACRBG0_11315 [Lewinella sp.]|uniref:hypothetical protein n=1 Tax=Lewinella sp. TaxID=2004506 RepID=UPI003D6A3CD6
MLSIFRTNQLLAGIVILGYTLFLHLADFWQSTVPLTPIPGLGNTWVTPWLDAAPNLCLGVVVVLLFLQAVFANAIIFAHRISSPVNLFPGVFVVLIGSLLPDFHVYSGYLIANVFLLLSLRSYLKAFRVNAAADHIFNTGFWIGIAALFVPAYLVFLLAYSAMLPILKSGKFRDQLIIIIGAIVPLYLVGIGYYWFDMMPLFWEQQWSSAFSWPQTITWSKIPIFANITMAALLLIILTSRRTYLTKTKMEVQIKIDILYWMLLGAGLSIWWFMPWNMQQWQTLVPIAGILLSFNFTKARPQTAEAWHLVLLIVLFYLNFAPILKLPIW